MNMTRIWKTIDKHLDFDGMWKRAVGFHNHEKYMGFKNWRLSAEYGIKEFKKAGARLEVIETPADGKTAALDHIMPMGWDCDFAKVEILDNNGPPEILVDSISAPLCLAPFSPPTPQKGIVAEVVHEYSYGQTPWKGKLILTADNPGKSLKERINKTGAAGVLCSWNMLSRDGLDSHQFLNCFTAGPGWYPPADEPPVILFSLSPRQGRKLADRMAEGRTRLRVTIQGKLGKDSFLTVSGAIPGAERKSAEVLAIAHMYEPFPTDDASGSSGAVEIIAAIKRAIAKGALPRPKRTIRSLLMWEQYGLAYFFEKSRKQDRDFLTAISMDCAGQGQAFQGGPLKFVYNSPTVPWGGVYPWLELIHKVLRKECGDKYQYREVRGYYGDDCFLSQPAYKVPTVWMCQPSGNYHHHNTRITWDKVDPGLYRAQVTTAAAYLYATAYAGGKEGRRWAADIFKLASENIGALLKKKDISYAQVKFEADYYAGCVESLVRLEETPGKAYRRRLENISTGIRRLAPERKKIRTVLSPMMMRAKNRVVKLSDPRCLPYDLAKIPFRKRRRFLPIVRSVLNWCDGSKNLAEALHLAGLEKNTVYTDRQIREIMRDLRFLAKAGYVDIYGKE